MAKSRTGWDHYFPRHVPYGGAVWSLPLRSRPANSFGIAATCTGVGFSSRMFGSLPVTCDGTPMLVNVAAAAAFVDSFSGRLVPSWESAATGRATSSALSSAVSGSVVRSRWLRNMETNDGLLPHKYLPTRDAVAFMTIWSICGRMKRLPALNITRNCQCVRCSPARHAAGKNKKAFKSKVEGERQTRRKSVQPHTRQARHARKDPAVAR